MNFFTAKLKVTMSHNLYIWFLFESSVQLKYLFSKLACKSLWPFFAKHRTFLFLGSYNFQSLETIN
jgi:hypothetical protein